MLTTANLRAQARNAEYDCKWAEAARLYREAIALYPSHRCGSRLENLDKSNLIRSAEECERMAQPQA